MLRVDGACAIFRWNDKMGNAQFFIVVFVSFLALPGLVFWLHRATVFLAFQITELRKFRCTWFGEVCSCPLHSRDEFQQTAYLPFVRYLLLIRIWCITSSQQHPIGARHGHCQIALDHDSFMIVGGWRSGTGHITSGENIA